MVNAAQQQLLYAKEAGDESWWGTWAEMLFTVTRDNPYITTPRGVARIEFATLCNWPITVQNQFYEYLQFGNGRLPKMCGFCPGTPRVYSRNNVVTFTDLSDTPQKLAAYLTNTEDVGKRVFFQGTDDNDSVIYTRDAFEMGKGVFVSLETPFVITEQSFNSITGIQKDVTSGEVQIFQVDPDTGDQVLLLTMEPGETTAFYRRYLMDPIPTSCCPGQDTVNVRAICKLELMPVASNTDYLLIQNIEAIAEEAASIRYAGMDTLSAKQMAGVHHQRAIGLLNGELTHYLGKNQPAVQFAPFGSARLEKLKIGTLI